MRYCIQTQFSLNFVSSVLLIFRQYPFFALFLRPINCRFDHFQFNRITCNSFFLNARARVLPNFAHYSRLTVNTCFGQSTSAINGCCCCLFGLLLFHVAVVSVFCYVRRMMLTGCIIWISPFWLRSQTFSFLCLCLCVCLYLEANARANRYRIEAAEWFFVSVDLSCSLAGCN